jgi:YHS domain-containing protein
VKGPNPSQAETLNESKVSIVQLGEETGMAKDPVCDMEVNEASARATFTHDGREFYFCATSCYNAFKKDPEQYLGPRKQRWWGRFLSKLARASQKTYGQRSPKCH